MENYEKEAIDAALHWNEEGFNKRDKKITIEGLHFPHIRLWENKFSIFEDDKEFLRGYDTQRLYAYLAERFLSFWFKKHTKYIEKPWIFVDQ